MTFLTRISLALALSLAASLGAMAQTAETPQTETVVPRQTLEDILARQAGEGPAREPRDFGTVTDRAADISGQLGTLGGASDAEVWEALRFGTADVRVSAGGPQARVVMQEGGMWWRAVREGPLATYGGYGLLAVIALLAVFFLLRGRIRIEHGFSSRKILRFNAIERFGHWLLAGSFILLGITGLITLFGRKGLIPLIGKDAYATLAGYSKWVHDNVGWAFIAGLVLVFLFWVLHNLPNRTDLVWFAKGGGIVGKAHPPAKKFNAGQKIIFWSVILLGGSIAATGLSLLFPFELPMFAATFAKLNAIGVPGLLGMEAFPEQLAAQEEMQYAQLWHSTVAFVLMGIILAHIYIGTIGMQGAFDAMGEGEVDLNWAKEHHSLWVEEVEAREAAGKGASATPAE